jgi:hypothetical protein
MNSKRKPKLFTLLGALVIVLAACGPSDTELTPTLNPDAIRTEVIETFASSLTQTALFLPTATRTLTPSPTNTPQEVSTLSTASSAAATSCYKLMYVKDVTIPDNTVMVAGETFTKTWQVQNTGGCAWAPGFKFSLVGGDAMSGQTLTVTQPVPVGSKTELSIDMVAPNDKAGVIQGSWRMSDNAGAFFGETLWVKITMGGTTNGTATTPAAASTPTPTQTTGP